MNWRASLRRAIKEPLVHFLMAGALLFLLLSGRAPDLGERRIVVDPAIAGALVGRFYDSFHRLPTPDENDGMIRDYVQDQVYYREALRLGLDQGDEVVVRRMRRKMEALAVADAETAEPRDADLQALIDRDPARYSLDPRTAFDQVYLGADTLPNRMAAGRLLVQARAGAAVPAVPSPLPAHVGDASAAQIAAQFGDEFAIALRRLAPGQWQGPVASGLGLHLVRVTARGAPVAPTLSAVRQRVTNDWRAAGTARAQADAYARMLKGYDVQIVLPK